MLGEAGIGVHEASIAACIGACAEALRFSIEIVRFASILAPSVPNRDEQGMRCGWTHPKPRLPPQL
jgi:hypothetical protein